MPKYRLADSAIFFNCFAADILKRRVKNWRSVHRFISVSQHKNRYIIDFKIKYIWSKTTSEPLAHSIKWEKLRLKVDLPEKNYFLIIWRWLCKISIAPLLVSSPLSIVHIGQNIRTKKKENITNKIKLFLLYLCYLKYII